MARTHLVTAGLALMLVFTCVTAFGQVQDVYQTTYFDTNLSSDAYDATIRIINPGLTGSPFSGAQGTLCASIFVFDADETMAECCSCPVTANGLLTLSVQSLTENPLTVTPFRGVIKLVSSIPTPLCDPTVLTPTPDLRAFATHLHRSENYKYFVTEEEFAPSPLGTSELSDLGKICAFLRYLGTGRGRCDYVCEQTITD